MSSDIATKLKFSLLADGLRPGMFIWFQVYEPLSDHTLVQLAYILKRKNCQMAVERLPFSLFMPGLLPTRVLLYHSHGEGDSFFNFLAQMSLRRRTDLSIPLQVWEEIVRERENDSFGLRCFPTREAYRATADLFRFHDVISEPEHLSVRLGMNQIHQEERGYKALIRRLRGDRTLR